MRRTWLIGLGGVAKAGKDTFADLLVEQGGWVKHYFSEPLEKALLALNPDIVMHFEDKDKGISWIEPMPYVQVHATMGYEKSKEIPGVRALLQRLGTEVGRKMFGENVWCDIARDKAAAGRADGYNVALTGVRFPNEIEMVRSQPDSLLVWVKRPGYEPINSHASDNSLHEDDFDVVLENDGTIATLRTTARCLNDVLKRASYLSIPTLLATSPQLRAPRPVSAAA